MILSRKLDGDARGADTHKAVKEMIKLRKAMNVTTLLDMIFLP
jgi:hypothetical protein